MMKTAYWFGSGQHIVFLVISVTNSAVRKWSHLNSRGDHGNIALQTSHLSYVVQIVHHDIGPSQLLPGLYRHSSHGALPHAIGNELAPPMASMALCLEGRNDLFELGNDEGVVLVAVGLDASQYLDGLLFAPDLRQPSGRLW